MSSIMSSHRGASTCICIDPKILLFVDYATLERAQKSFIIHVPRININRKAARVFVVGVVFTHHIGESSWLIRVVDAQVEPPENM